jgi:hypothetical protein
MEQFPLYPTILKNVSLVLHRHSEFLEPVLLLRE